MNRHYLSIYLCFFCRYTVWAFMPMWLVDCWQAGIHTDHRPDWVPVWQLYSTAKRGGSSSCIKIWSPHFPQPLLDLRAVPLEGRSVPSIYWWRPVEPVQCCVIRMASASCRKSNRYRVWPVIWHTFFQLMWGWTSGNNYAVALTAIIGLNDGWDETRCRRQHSMIGLQPTSTQIFTSARLCDQCGVS